MAAAGGAMMPGGPGAMQGGGGPRPTIRNPIVTFLMFMIPFYNLFLLYSMIHELKEFTQDPDFFEFGWIVPCYSIYWFFVPFMQQIAKGKQIAGAPPPQSIILYLFVSPFALAKDLNQMADPSWTG
jgi:hypothetical protein